VQFNDKLSEVFIQQKNPAWYYAHNITILQNYDIYNLLADKKQIVDLAYYYNKR
jgi:hypothetical protein